MKIGIADDLIEDSDLLITLIKDYFSACGKEAEISRFFDGESLLMSFSPGCYDIVFLDIYMKDLSGIDTARRICKADRGCKIVFLTTSNEFAAESYEVKAFSYLIKPATPEQIRLIFDRVFHEGKLPSATVPLKLFSSKNTTEIDISNIRYIEMIQRNVYIHLTFQTFKVSGTFGEYSEILLKYPCFIESIRGLIVNMDRIVDVEENSFVLDNGDRVPIRRRNNSQIKTKYMKYKLECI